MSAAEVQEANRIADAAFKEAERYLELSKLEQAESKRLRGYLRDAIANLDPSACRDYELWRQAAAQ